MHTTLASAPPSPKATPHAHPLRSQVLRCVAAEDSVSLTAHAGHNATAAAAAAASAAASPPRQRIPTALQPPLQQQQEVPPPGVAGTPGREQAA